MTTSIFGSTLSELQALCIAEGWPKYVASQLCDWMYKKRVCDFSLMSNLSVKVRGRLAQLDSESLQFTPAIVDCQISRDGTKKYLFQIAPNQSNDPLVNYQAHNYVETVFIPVAHTSTEPSRATLCISCQRGCKMGCRFCVTGKQGFHGSLTTAQILHQIFDIPESTQLTNIVYMGMGEPMDNYDAVMRSTEILTSDWGLGWSPTRITISTVGITPGIERFLNENRCHLAVSMHNPFHDERLEIMPMEKAFPLADTIQLLSHYDWSGQRRISFEYTMLRNHNDSLRHADGIVKLLQPLKKNGGMPRVNLIRFHASPNAPFQTSNTQTINSFMTYLNQHGITCTLRASRGEDIQAACGLLAGSKRENV
ncbi:MAG: radical SAM protein [Bacteroidales bacterium]|nr:radical SAM protein [Candidatus Colimorpha onthohippi]